MATRAAVVLGAFLAVPAWAGDKRAEAIAEFEAHRAERKLGGSPYFSTVTPIWPAHASDDDSYASTDSLFELFGNSLTMSNNASTFTIGQTGWSSIATGKRALPGQQLFVSPNVLQDYSGPSDYVPNLEDYGEKYPEGFGISQATSADGDILIVGLPLYGINNNARLLERRNLRAAAEAAGNATAGGSRARLAQSLPNYLGLGAAAIYTGCASTAGCTPKYWIENPNPSAFSLFGLAVGMSRDGLSFAVTDILAHDFYGAVYVYNCTKKGVCATQNDGHTLQNFPTVIQGPSQDWFLAPNRIRRSLRRNLQDVPSLSCPHSDGRRAAAADGKRGLSGSERAARRMSFMTNILGDFNPFEGDADDVGTFHLFGWNVQVADAGNTIVVGSPSYSLCGPADPNANNTDSGAIYVYRRKSASGVYASETLTVGTATPDTIPMSTGNGFGQSISITHIGGGKAGKSNNGLSGTLIVSSTPFFTFSTALSEVTTDDSKLAAGNSGGSASIFAFFCPSTEFASASCYSVANLTTAGGYDFEFASGIAVAVSPDSAGSTIAATASNWICQGGRNLRAASKEEGSSPRALRAAGKRDRAAQSFITDPYNWYGCKMHHAVHVFQRQATTSTPWAYSEVFADRTYGLVDTSALTTIWDRIRESDSTEKRESDYNEAEWILGDMEEGLADLGGVFASPNDDNYRSRNYITNNLAALDAFLSSVVVDASGSTVLVGLATLSGGQSAVTAYTK